MINDINFFIQWYVNMSHYLWPHGPCVTSVTFVPVASDPEGQLSDQSDIPANSEVSEVVINCVVSKDNLWRRCGLKITTRPSCCACMNIECTSICVCLARVARRFLVVLSGLSGESSSCLSPSQPPSPRPPLLFSAPNQNRHAYAG